MMYPDSAAAIVQLFTFTQSCLALAVDKDRSLFAPMVPANCSGALLLNLQLDQFCVAETLAVIEE